MQSCRTRAKAYRRKTSCMHMVAVIHTCDMATISKVIRLMFTAGHWSFVLASYSSHLSPGTHMTVADVRQAAVHVQLQVPVVNRIWEVVVAVRHSLFRSPFMLPVTTCRSAKCSLSSWQAGKCTGMKAPGCCLRRLPL